MSATRGQQQQNVAAGGGKGVKNMSNRTMHHSQPEEHMCVQAPQQHAPSPMQPDLEMDKDIEEFGKDLIDMQELVFSPLDDHAFKKKHPNLMTVFCHFKPVLKPTEFGFRAYELGSGTFGTTVIAGRGLESSTAIVLAVKFLKPQCGTNIHERAMFRFEAKVLRRLTQEQQKVQKVYVPPFEGYGFCSVGEPDEERLTPFLAMQLQVTTARQVTKGAQTQLAAGAHARQLPSWKTLLTVALQVARALDWLHRQQHILHGDFKSSNLWWNGRGDAGLLDFGMCKELRQLEGGGKQAQPTADVRHRRPPAKYWIAPECTVKPKGNRLHVSVAASFDWWGFGCWLVQHFYLEGIHNKDHSILDLERQIWPAIRKSHMHLQVASIHGGMAEEVLSLVRLLLSTQPERRPTGEAVVAKLTKLRNTVFRQKKTPAKRSTKRKHSDTA
jgi:serine/threonine protein kinase